MPLTVMPFCFRVYHSTQVRQAGVTFILGEKNKVRVQIAGSIIVDEKGLVGRVSKAPNHHHFTPQLLGFVFLNFFSGKIFFGTIVG